MGWFTDDHPGHEGYTVGLIPVEPPKVRCQRTPRKDPHDCKRTCPGDPKGYDPCLPVDGPGAAEFFTWLSFSDQWRELRYPEKYEGAIRRVQGACSCGWRSQVLTAPFRTHYVPHMVFFDEAVEKAAEDDVIAQWKHHLQTPAPARLGLVKL